jgi:hypothetical protein
MLISHFILHIVSSFTYVAAVFCTPRPSVLITHQNLTLQACSHARARAHKHNSHKQTPHRDTQTCTHSYTYSHICICLHIFTHTLTYKHFKQVAGVILEPVVGNGGFIPPNPGFLQGLRDMCTEEGTVLCFDEVMTGFRISKVRVCLGCWMQIQLFVWSVCTLKGLPVLCVVQACVVR